MVKICFEEIKLRGKRRWKDANGKWHQETKVFFQTVNPFNKNAADIPKTMAEIQLELIDERKAWLAAPLSKQEEK